MEDKKEVLKKDNFPSNSHKEKVEVVKKEESKKVEKIIKGSAVKKKKTFGKRFTETFIGDDIDNVGSYLLHDVLIPAAKSTISDMVQGGIEMLLFGDKKGSRTSRDRGRSYVSYNNYSSRDRDRDRDRKSDRREISSSNRARHNFDDVVLSSRGEAEEVLSHLVDLVIDYGQASVGDLYDLVGITSSFTDQKYGWTDLSSASVSRARDGYLLNLPRTKVLD